MGTLSLVKTFTLELDLKNPTDNRDFEVVDGDTGNILNIALTDDGQAVALDGYRVIAVFSNSNGTFMQDGAEADGGITVSGNNISIELFPASFAPGLVECELQVYAEEVADSTGSGTTEEGTTEEGTTEEGTTEEGTTEEGTTEEGATEEGSGDEADSINVRVYSRLVTTARFNFKCRRSILNDETITTAAEFPPLMKLINNIQLAEKGRKENEIERINNEFQRFENERIRLTGENSRVRAEDERIEAENLRQAAELERSRIIHGSLEYDKNGFPLDTSFSGATETGWYECMGGILAVYTTTTDIYLSLVQAGGNNYYRVGKILAGGAISWGAWRLNSGSKAAGDNYEFIGELSLNTETAEYNIAKVSEWSEIYIMMRRDASNSDISGSTNGTQLVVGISIGLRLGGTMYNGYIIRDFKLFCDNNGLCYGESLITNNTSSSVTAQKSPVMLLSETDDGYSIDDDTLYYRLLFASPDKGTDGQETVKIWGKRR